MVLEGLTVGSDHEYVVLAGIPVCILLSVAPLHMVSSWFLLIIVGDGFTVIIALNLAPAQVPVIGVIS